MELILLEAALVAWEEAELWIDEELVWEGVIEGGINDGVWGVEEDWISLMDDWVSNIGDFLC